MTIFRQLYDAPTTAYTYLIADTGAGAAVVIDPAAERMIVTLLALLAELDLQLEYVLCTHTHPGDPAVADAIRARTAAKVAAGERAPVVADCRLRHGDTVTFGNEVIHVLGTPGHTPGCLSYLWRDRVFTGDALLIRACGPTNLPDADAGALYDSITKRLLVLPGDTLVYPGHDGQGRTVSTITEERERNPCVAGRSRDEFITQRISG
jgi:glyoxylase-like metal-dependent hydrolase (beta-lactamase superfamily II)